MKRRRTISVLVFGVLLQGCATIFTGTTQLVTINSNVNGAEVWFNQTLLGKTPLIAPVKRGQEGILKVHAPGYQDYQVAINKKINNVAYANFFGNYSSSTSFTVDYTSGAMYEYEPSIFMASLLPQRTGTQQLNEWQRREKLRGFVLLNGDALASNLAAGHGEYVDVLIDAISVKQEARAKAIERWRADFAASRTAAEFAERIVAEARR